MSRKLTITLDDEVYQGLYEKVGSRRIAGFIQELVRPYVVGPDLEASYAEMAAHERRERDAAEWADDLIADAVERAIKVQLGLR